MVDQYLGILPAAEPLHAFLQKKVLAEVLGVNVPQPVFDRHALDPKLVIVRYTERHTGTQVVCKFYGRKPPDDPEKEAQPGYFRQMLNQEFDNLRQLWQLGFDRPPYRVVRPLATFDIADHALVEEYVAGPKLDTFLQAAAQGQEEEQLYERLTDLAAFLAKLHQYTVTLQRVDAQAGVEYLDKMVRQLLEKKIISTEQATRLERLRDEWAGSGLLEAAQEVTIHGDATPVNFVFHDQGEVVAIDLERLRSGDALVDVGCVAAEVRHAFFLTTGDPQAGEAFIQHFYARYTERQPVDPNFETITGRTRFWMGVTELRICRNDWLDLPYRQRLAEEAERCLRW